jgi:PGF-pre-PGF domain-containing protein
VGSYEGDTLMSTSNVDPFSNILKYETREINLLRNVSVKYEFATPEFSIYQVFVNNKDQELLTPMRIEHLKDTSMYTKKDVPGLVYANENVWIGTERINYISVKFRVDNSWIDKNVTNDKIVALLRWNGTMWLSYGVTMTGTDTSYTYFESRNMIMPTLRNAKASLSIFSVSALPKKANEEIKTNVTSVANVTNVTDDTTHVQGEVVFSDKNEMGINDPRKLPGFDIVTVMISIILSIVIKRKIGKNL